ncbi:MAG: ketoacid CoA transferase, partial [Novosphingobium sp. 35-62-5]
VTNLCVMDFGGPDHAIRLVSLHPGVTFEDVQAATGFELVCAESVTETALPTAEALEVIASLDPHNIRASVLKDNPPAKRAA